MVRTKQHSITSTLSVRRLRWLGHVLWMDHQHIPQQALHWEVQGLKRGPGRPKTNWRGGIKKDLWRMDSPGRRQMWQLSTDHMASTCGPIRLYGCGMNQGTRTNVATHSHSPEGSSCQHIALIFRLLPTPFPVNVVNDGDHLELYRVHIGWGKTRMAGLQSGEDRMMIDSVVWAQYVTDTQPHRQPRRQSKCRANALRRAAKTHRFPQTYTWLFREGTFWKWQLFYSWLSVTGRVRPPVKLSWQRELCPSQQQVIQAGRDVIQAVRWRLQENHWQSTKRWTRRPSVAPTSCNQLPHNAAR